MRKVLLGSSALFTALMLAVPAYADLEVSLGGFVLTQAGFFDNDTQTNASHRDFREKSELRLNAKGYTDGGLEYGARIDLLTATDETVNARRTGIYLSNAYGRLEMGDLDGASGTLSVLAPTVGIGQINGSYANFVPAASGPAGSMIDTGGGMIRPMDTDQATKVTYYTPRISGFQAGVSYAPEVDNSASGEAVQFSNTAGTQDNAYEVGLNYRATYQNGVRVVAGLVGDFASAKTTAREDIRAWGLGLQVGYKAFQFGGGYVNNGDSNNLANTADDNETAWNVGGRYQTGPWGLALNYIHEDYGTAGGRGTDISGGTYAATVLGGSYKIADGLTAGADLSFFDRNKTTGTDDNGYVLVIETKAAF